MFQKKWQLSITIACACLGLLLSLQLTAHRAMSEDLNYQTNDTLAVIARNLYTKYYQLMQEVWDLRAQLRVMEQSADQNKATQETMARELQKLNISMGAVPVEGPGLVITVPPNDFNIFFTYQDLIDIVNELWNAGAEAVAVNGIRMTNNTSIRPGSDFSTILVNGRTLYFPYEIQAIGDPVALEKGISIPSGIVDNLKTIYRIPLEIEQVEKIQLNGSRIPDFQYAQSVPPAPAKS